MSGALYLTLHSEVEPSPSQLSWPVMSSAILRGMRGFLEEPCQHLSSTVCKLEEGAAQRQTQRKEPLGSPVHLTMTGFWKESRICLLKTLWRLQTSYAE